MLPLQQAAPADPALQAMRTNYLKKLAIFLTTNGGESNMRPKNVKQQAIPFIETALRSNPPLDIQPAEDISPALSAEEEASN